MVLRLIVLARAPNVTVAISPSSPSQSPNVTVSATSDLGAFLVHSFQLHVLSDSTPDHCYSPRLALTNGTASSATWLCDGLSSGVHR